MLLITVAVIHSIGIFDCYTFKAHQISLLIFAVPFHWLYWTKALNIFTQAWKRTTSDPSGLMPNYIITSRC